MIKYREYTDEQVIVNSKNVKSIAGLLKSLNLEPVGGNYAHMKKTLQRLKVDTNHWTGQGWNKGQQLKDWSSYSKVSSLKPHLISIRGHKCEICKNELWIGEKIPLEVHHIDGDRTNNSFDNLQLVCLNCHSLTDGFRNRK